jgi:hypothetical protein
MPEPRGEIARKCDFCGAKFRGLGRYIYPIPKGFLKTEPPISAGMLACLDCAPSLLEAQIEQGLVRQVGGR